MHVILLYFFLVTVVLGGVESNSCNQHLTCHDCIRDASSCIWCSSNAYDDEHRCHSKDANITGCTNHIENPGNEINIVKGYDFSSSAGTICQMKPQKYKLKLRPGQPLDFSFSFAAVEDYPVDVYFLLDASNTMSVIREAAVNQTENIYETLYNYTKDVYLGMGTFIDKNALPFNVEIYKHQAYSFKNNLKLNSNYTKFREVMRNTEFGSNRDSPEGGLDGLAQAIVCKEEIGWRSESRKLIVFLTDGPYHAAGDGRSAGIFQPYDGKCYSNKGTYENELKMDYPSVSMINKLAIEHDVIIIFAIARSVADEYARMNAAISGAHTTILSNEKDNIVKILREIYEKITKKIKLHTNIISGQRNNFKLKFNPDCTSSKKNNEDCNVNTGKIYNFTGTISLPEYITGVTNKGVIDIGIEGINDKLTLDIEIINECACTKEASAQKDCNDEVRECGICKCKEPKYGLNCACVRNEESKVDDAKACNNGTKIDCNGQGICNCGKCKCKPGFGGKNCECNLMLCPRDSHGELCSGDKQGDCQCDRKCKCKSGWSGQACECSDNVELCTGFNGKVCNDRGICVCERCHCEDPENWDSRTEVDEFCIPIPNAETSERQCKLLSDCVICILKEERNCCSFLNYTLVDQLDINDADVSEKESTLWQRCPNVRIDVGCYTNFTYKYEYEKYGVLLKIQKDYNCAESYLIYGGILLVTLILVGVATLVAWKLLTDARDRREYLHFLKSNLVDNVSENPLYEPASTTFRNPAFKRSFSGK